jgi:hypothetical protein
MPRDVNKARSGDYVRILSRWADSGHVDAVRLSAAA